MRNIQDNKLTSIQVEGRKLLHPRLMGLLVLEDPEPGWVRTYSIEGWQRFPITFIEEHSVLVEPREVIVLEFELKAKGYKCSFGTIITNQEQETNYDSMET